MSEQFIPALIDGEINPQLLKRSRYEIAGLQFCNREGLGSVPNVDNIGYMGALILMKPSQYLSLVPSLGGFTKTVNFLKTGQETLFGTPFLDININEETRTAQVKGHEGRSRMSFFREVTGDAPVPVALFIRESNFTLRARHIEPWMLELIQSGVTSERTEVSRGDYVEGPLFDQAAYLDKGSRIARISLPASDRMLSF
ncbi:hypothetical protein [Rhizobium sp. MHM7A]|uniref:hypothetical protein n=1 Tax=Rhizobium sp. MHM7A TaxID=2583233 RepID=UPI001105A2F3|nr:hypothetical protein [Rhizobium sp. MHM7A]TLX16640.1 hypothetical protein FFR93_04675 [Rhizobium sp. MHM7A]